MQEVSCRAILFDLDGVLVDSTRTVERHWHMWAVQHGLDSQWISANSPWKASELTLAVDTGMNQLMAGCGKTFGKGQTGSQLLLGLPPLYSEVS